MGKGGVVRREEQGKREGKRHHESGVHDEEGRARRRRGHRRRSSAENEGGSRGRVRRRKSRPAEQQGGGSVSDDQRGHHTPDPHPEPHQTHHQVSSTLHPAASARDFGPDGTPYGLLPTRAKGVGWVPHVKAVHRHIVAEQEAGLRSKGMGEKCFEEFLKKRRAAKAARGGGKGKGKEEVGVEVGGEGHEGSGEGGSRSHKLRKDRRKEPVVEKIGSEWNETGGGGGSGSRKLRKRRGGRQAGSDERALPGSGGDGLSGGHEVYPPHGAEGLVQRPALSGRSTPEMVQPSAEESRNFLAGEKGSGSDRQEAPCAPVVRFRSPTPPRQLTPARLPTPRGSHKSHDSDDVDRESVEGYGSRDVPPTPVVLIQSATPTRQRTPLRLMTPPGSPSHHVKKDVTASVGVNTAEEKTAIEDRVENSGRQITPKQVTPVRSLTPASQITLLSSSEDSYSASHSSLLPMFLRDEESAVRPVEAHIEHPHFEAPVYEATPHSISVEVLERAQAVEERERRQEAESACRTETPLTAPQPKVALPTKFEAGLVAEAGLIAKARLVNLTKQDDGGLSKVPEHRESPRAEREMKNSSFKPEDGDLIDLRSDRGPSSNSRRGRDAGTRKLIWGQEPNWNFDNLNKHTET